MQKKTIVVTVLLTWSLTMNVLGFIKFGPAIAEAMKPAKVESQLARK